MRHFSRDGGHTSRTLVCRPKHEERAETSFAFPAPSQPCTHLRAQREGQVGVGRPCRRRAAMVLPAACGQHPVSNSHLAAQLICQADRQDGAAQLGARAGGQG